MAESEAFQTLAEFGIALAGFTSIVVVFGRGGGEFHPADRFRVFSALVPSLGAAFLALVPVGLDLTGLPPLAVWRVSSVVLVAAVGSYFAFSDFHLRRLAPQVRAVISSRLGMFFRVLWLSSIIAGVLNGTGALFSPQAGVYFFAVLSPLVVGAIVFVRMVFIRPAG